MKSLNNIYQFVVILIGISVFSCNENHYKPNVLIKKSADTILIGDVFEAKLFLNNEDSICHADFYIVQNGDTFLLDYNSKERYAMFKATTTSPGEKRYFGFVKFHNKEEVFKTDDFCITFYSK